MSPVLKTNDFQGLTRREIREQKSRKRRRFWTILILGTVGTSFLLILSVICIGFFTSWGSNLRLTIAESVISSRHYQWAHYFTTNAEYNRLIAQRNQTPLNTGVSKDVHVTTQHQVTTYSAIEIRPLDGLPSYNGYVVLIHNPKLVRLVHAQVNGSQGEYITDMVKRVGAVAGINASGFEDPNGNGWGGVPVGLEMVGGKVLNQTPGAAGWTTVGFTDTGVMVMGQYSVQQLKSYGVRDAMQFHPELVVNGKPMITTGDGGWGADPRTAIGQTRDGTIILIVTNGRFRGGAGLGATQRQIMDLMLKYGAYNACAMDGGSSSVLDYHGELKSTSSSIDPHGERRLPDAWLVFPTVAAANAYSPMS